MHKPQREPGRMTSYFFFFCLFFPLFSFAQLNNAYITMPCSTSEHWLFTVPQDTLTGNWKYIAPLPKELYGVCSYFWQDSNKVFICGGADSNGVPQRTCYFYNIQTNSYELKDSLPSGRALGKLVRVKDSLYLIGSVGSNWNFPDGATFKYDPKKDEWVSKAPTSLPRLHEMAVCVWDSSLIITVGGSTNGFNGATRSVRVYDPVEDSWVILNDSSFLPVTTTSAHAECIGNNIVVLGGLGVTFNNTVYRGYVYNNSILRWRIDTVTPYGFGVYRVGGARWGDYMLFGPAMRNSTCYGQIWGFNINDSTWIRFLPNTIDSAGNRTTIAVRTTQDSVYFYLFGGITVSVDSVVRIKTIAKSERFAFGNPFIGISSNNENLPVNFKLYQNYPNPFNPVTTIKFDIPDAVTTRRILSARLVIYDILGREVEVLVNKELSPGTYEVIWDGSRLSSGIYFYKLTVAGFTSTKKMLMIK